jgi:DNA-binding LacI/PurR family transcriptional regulator/DNA-binding transcriptional regulator YhcF (GntR family)
MKNTLTRSSPSLARSLQFLRRSVTLAASHDITHLPGIRELARSAHVSPVTMLRAVRVLAGEGLLRVEHGRGIFRPTPALAAPPVLSEDEVPTRFAPRWESVRRRISDELLSREVGSAGVLPTAKELRERYAASHITVQRALASLVADGRLVRHKRTYRVAGPMPRPRQSSLLFLAAMDLMGILTNLGPRAPDLWRSMEQECRRLNLTLEVYDYMKSTAAFPWPDGTRRRLFDKRKGLPVVGSIIWTFGLPRGPVAQLLALAQETGKPIAVLNETWETPLAELAQDVAATRRARLFSVATGPACGEEVGRCLVSLGHRRAAVFCPSNTLLGWDERYRGIARAFEQAGCAEGTRLFSIPLGEDVALTREDRVLARYESYTHRTLDPDKDHLTDSFFPNHLAPFLNAKRQQIRMAPLFQKALQDRTCTAWVGLSDSCARTALDFLHRRGVGVPGEISLVGFDNEAESFATGLSSYDFNMAAAVGAMLEHIMGSPLYSSPAKPQSVVVEIPGRVVARATTGPVRVG